jgi:hypothetical protein
MNRDVTEFNGRGITQDDINDFETQGNEFEAFSPDIFYQMFVTQEVKAKNNARANCVLQARKMAGIVEQVYGNKSGVYKGMRYSNVSKAKDDSFITLIRNIAKVCESFLANLSPAGMTQVMIDNLRAEAQVMEDKYHAIALKEGERDDATEERINLANALYNNLAKYCQIGKSIWDDISEAKYNDYVINPTVQHNLPKVQNLVAVPNGEDPFVADLRWDAVAGASDYRIYQSQVNAGSPAGEFEPIEETDMINYNAQMEPGFTYYWKVRAISADSQGAFSDEVSLTPIENNG